MADAWIGSVATFLVKHILVSEFKRAPETARNVEAKKQQYLAQGHSLTCATASALDDYDLLDTPVVKVVGLGGGCKLCKT